LVWGYMRRMAGKITVITAVLAIISIYICPAVGFSYSVHHEQTDTCFYAPETFDMLNRQIAGGNGYKDADNSTGTLAWAESYIMEAYTVMYEATRDPAYLDIRRRDVAGGGLSGISVGHFTHIGLAAISVAGSDRERDQGALLSSERSQ